MMYLWKKARQFHCDESGVAAVELVLVVPILAWALLSTFVYFDAYRAESLSTRAGLTIADMFSRENTAISGAYMDGARSLLRTLTEAEASPDLRVTLYEYVGDSSEYKVVWSQNEGYTTSLNNAMLASVTNRLPRLADGGIALLVETRTNYTAPFKVSIAPFDVTDLTGVMFNTFTVISPRFAPTICWQETSSSPQFCRLPPPIP